ncbi:MAG: rRNA maturation RNase YbeY [Acholeplasmatales bacterium]|jgi:probable rRNA maturation factor|nr:rRNA maturation RNase YbeY [Acholeplasmatales bacterium]
MKIKIFNYTSEDLNEKSLILEKVFKYLKNKKTLSIIFYPKDMMIELNKKYLNHDYLTDVLSFPDDLSDDSLGDIFISPLKILEQAEEKKNSFNYEMVYLAIHGYLHLLGYLHDSDTQYEEMEKAHNEIMSIVSRRKLL